MPSLVDWLLIGGTSHGMVVTVKNLKRVESFGMRYTGEDYRHTDGKVYRVGRCRPTEAESAEIGALIEKQRPRRLP